MIQKELKVKFIYFSNSQFKNAKEDQIKNQKKTGKRRKED